MATEVTAMEYLLQCISIMIRRSADLSKARIRGFAVHIRSISIPEHSTGITPFASRFVLELHASRVLKEGIVRLLLLAPSFLLFCRVHELTASLSTLGEITCCDRSLCTCTIQVVV